MRITWLAHAAFLIEGGGLRVLTDPYRPETVGLERIPDEADVVLRSSSNDRAHCWIEGLAGSPEVVTATGIPAAGAVVRGMRVFGIPARENVEVKSDPRANAMYRFELEGMTIVHFGDAGNRLTREQIDALRGGGAGAAGPDIAFVPAGGPPTIPLLDLRDGLAELRPRCVIPMHFQMPGNRIRMLPVEDFLRLMPQSAIERRADSWVEVSRETLPAPTRIMVLAPRMARVEPGTGAAT